MKQQRDLLFSLAPPGSAGQGWDARYKLLALPFLGAAFVTAPGPLLLAPWVFLALGYMAAGVSLGRAALAAKWFAFLVVLLTATRGTQIAFSLPPSLAISPEGAFDGMHLGFQIFGVALTGHLYTAMTPREETVRSLEWFLRPALGRRRSADLAVIVGLSLSTVPIIRRSIREAGDSLDARALSRGVRVRRVKLISTLAVQNLLRRSGAMAEALVSRGYTGENRSLAFVKASAGFSVFLPCLVLFLALLFLGR